METKIVESNSLVLTQDWLDSYGNITNGSSSITSFSNCLIPFQNFYIPNYHIPFQTQYYPVYYEFPKRPIKLTTSEIEKLKEAASKNQSIRDILVKFTDLIEIEVKF